jgi:hypothetical protein
MMRVVLVVSVSLFVSVPVRIGVASCATEQEDAMHRLTQHEIGQIGGADVGPAPGDLANEAKNIGLGALAGAAVGIRMGNPVVGALAGGTVGAMRYFYCYGREGMLCLAPDPRWPGFN